MLFSSLTIDLAGAFARSFVPNVAPLELGVANDLVRSAFDALVLGQIAAVRVGDDASRGVSLASSSSSLGGSRRINDVPKLDVKAVLARGRRVLVGSCCGEHVSYEHGTPLPAIRQQSTDARSGSSRRSESADGSIAGGGRNCDGDLSQKLCERHSMDQPTNTLNTFELWRRISTRTHRTRARFTSATRCICPADLGVEGVLSATQVLLLF